MLKQLKASKENLQTARDDLQKACDHDKAQCMAKAYIGFIIPLHNKLRSGGGGGGEDAAGPEKFQGLRVYAGEIQHQVDLG